MRYILLFLSFLALSSQRVAAEELPLYFDGEIFRKGFSATSPGGDRIFEYVRRHETVHNWTKLVAVRYQKLPKLDNDPTKAAVEMAHVVKASNPKAGYSIISGKNEAMLDFVTWPKNRRYVEFCVVRYARTPDGKALASLRFGYRFSDTSSGGIKRFKKQRQAWLQKVAAFDFNQLGSYPAH